MKSLALAAAAPLVLGASLPPLPPLFKVELPARFYEALPRAGPAFEPPRTSPRFFPPDRNNRRLA